MIEPHGGVELGYLRRQGGELVGSLTTPGPVKRAGRRGRPDADYLRMARRYVAAIEVEPRAPIKRIVADLQASGEHATDDEVRAQVNEAKNRGILTRGRKGVAGGEWTDKGRHLLAQMGLED